MTELLEREQFLESMTSTLQEASNGVGCVVLVSGEAGIGKTSLVEKFASELDGKARVLWGGCEALFTPRPLGPLHDIARQARGRLLSLLEDEAPRLTIFSAFLDALQHQDSLPSIAVIEDAHWADEATLDLLKGTDSVKEIRGIHIAYFGVWTYKPSDRVVVAWSISPQVSDSTSLVASDRTRCRPRRISAAQSIHAKIGNYRDDRVFRNLSLSAIPQHCRNLSGKT